MDLPKRKRNRLVHYDYSRAGAYFVTICTEERRKILCDILGDGKPVPKDPGIIAEEIIRKIPEKYASVCVDHYVVMPNHIHMLLRITEHSGTGNPSPTLGNIVGWYKYELTKRINEKTANAGNRILQRSFHDHVIRGEKDYQRIWNYIDGNPLRWKEDCFYSP